MRGTSDNKLVVEREQLTPMIRRLDDYRMYEEGK